MKKTFQLTHPKIKYPRMVDSVKNDIRKYIKRERKNDLPSGIDFWDFDCKVGPTVEEATELHVAEINDAIDHAFTEKWDAVYLEILAKPGIRTRKAKEPTEES